MTADELVAAHFPDARRNGSGWLAKCPAHEDTRASLSIADGNNGKPVLKCFAGCSNDDILAALGLTWSKLLGDSGHARATAPKAATKKQPRTFPSANEAIEALEAQLGRHSGQWTYFDASGEPCGVVVRWDGPNGKVIRPINRHGDTWRIGAMRSPRPLYRLPDLREADPKTPVFITEGEKKNDALAAFGLLTTTSAGGANSAQQTDWSSLAGRTCVMLPDCDKAGAKYADSVTKLLHSLNPPAVVKIVQLPGLGKGEDVADWIPRFGGDKRAALAELNRLVDAAVVVESVQPLADGPILRCMADIAPREVRWLWPGRVALRRITLLVGRPGEGKTFLMLDMAARVSAGSPWPDNAGLAPAGSVILVCAEDDPADTIAPRLLAHHADVHKVHLLSAVRRHKEGKPYEVMFTLTDLDSLEASLKLHPDCKLVVVDPIGSFLGGKIDAHRDNEVRSVLAPVAQLAEKYGPAVVIVAHRRKALGSIADDLALGSRAFTGIARAVWHVTRDTEDKSRRLLLPGKTNIGPEGTGLAFSIAGEPPRIRWERDPVSMSADDALAVENGMGSDKKPGPKPEARNAAADWLRSALANGSRLAKELNEEAKEAQAITAPTLRRARQDVGVIAYRPAVPGPWWWRLPGQDVQHAEDCPKDMEPEHLEHLAEN